MKKFLLIIFLIFLCFSGWWLLSSSNNKIASGKITIHFWNGFAGPDGITMLELVKKFNNENPNIQVLMQRMDWATYYNKLTVAGLRNRAPELFIIHMEAMARFIDAGFLEELNHFMISEDDKLIENDLLSTVKPAVTRDNKYFGLPFDTHTVGMYYNRKLFIDAGIVDSNNEPKAPRTRQEFISALRKLTKDKDGNGSIDRWGFVYTWLRTNVYSIMHQFGGGIFDEKTNRCTLDCKENIEALNFCRSIIQDNLVPSPTNFDSWIGFRQGKVAMVFEGPYMMPDLQKQKDLNYEPAILPVLGYKPATWGSGHVLCMRTRLDENERKAVWQFMKFLSDNSLQWAGGGQIPVRKSLLNTDIFKAMKVQSVFAKQLNYAVYCPRTPYIAEIMNEFDIAIESVLRGTQTAENALKHAADNVNSIIASHSNKMENAK